MTVKYFVPSVIRVFLHCAVLPPPRRWKCEFSVCSADLESVLLCPVCWGSGPSAGSVSCCDCSHSSVSKQICADGFKSSPSDSSTARTYSLQEQLRGRQGTWSTECSSGSVQPVRWLWRKSEAAAGWRRVKLTVGRSRAASGERSARSSARILAGKLAQTSPETLLLVPGCCTRLIDENCSGEGRSPSDKQPVSLRWPCRTRPLTSTTTRCRRLRSHNTISLRSFSGSCWLWPSPVGTCWCASACTWRRLSKPPPTTS